MSQPDDFLDFGEEQSKPAAANSYQNNPYPVIGD